MPQIREILMIPHTHHDLGYTHVPEVCMQMHERGLYEIITLCEQGDDSAPDSFRWTIEITRSLIDFFRYATPEWIDRLRALVQRKRITVTGAYAHMTQLMGHEEYIRFFYPLREIREQHHFPVTTLQHGDINGLSWGVVPLMNELGLDTLVMALNPDHGYAPFEQPTAFYWEGQDGSRVLVWLSMFYSLANNPWELTAGRIDKAIDPVQAIIKRLEERDDYPFDFAVIHSAEDNMLPNDKICEAVRQWNERGLQPPMRIATIDEAMDRAKQQARDLRVVRGEWADWWAHGHSSTAYEVGLSRLARAELRAAEISRVLAALNGGAQTQLQLYDLPIVNWYRVSNLPLSRYDWRTRVNGVYDNLLLFAEHTWGPFETVSHPHSVFTRAHWHLKANFAYQAVTEAHNLSREALTDLATTLPPADAPAAVIVNPLSVTRSELVTVRTPGINHTVLVRDIPPLGVKVIPWDAEQFDALIDLEASNTIENEFYRITVDPQSAAITSLIDKATGKEWIDANAIAGLGAVVYEATAADEPHPSVSVHRSNFHPTKPGPNFTYTPASGTGDLKIQRTHYGTIITMQARHAYLPFVQTEIILHDAFKAIDVNVMMDKIENYAIEGVYVLFPFALEPASFFLETANAVYQADEEQVPRSCRDWYSIQHGMGVTDGMHSVLWATREAPLVQLSDFHTGQWSTELGATRGHIYSWLMNNLYFTNFKAAQGGRSAFSYRFSTREGRVERSEVRAFGEAFGHPPMGRVARVQLETYEWLRVEPETVQVQVLKPSFADNDTFVIRLKETAGQPTQARIIWANPTTVQLMRSDLLELTSGEPLQQQGSAFIIEMAAHELATIHGRKG